MIMRETTLVLVVIALSAGNKKKAELKSSFVDF